MDMSSCKVLFFRYSPFSSNDDEFRPFYIANCFFNGFLCCNVVMLNIVTICGIMRTSSLPKTLKTLLLSLAVSDGGVGFLVQPLYIWLILNGLHKMEASCNTYAVFEMMMGLFPTASFLSVVALSVDRFLAIQFHLRYQEVVTHKRVVAVVISIWLLSISFSLTAWWLPEYINFTTVCVGGVIGLVLTRTAYLKIYLVVRRHKRNIRTLQVQRVTQTSEMKNFASLTKSIVCIFYVHIVIWICYFPTLIICWAAMRASNSPSIDLKRLFLFSCTLVFLNSFLNPIIYCWKMRNIRHAVIDML